jgi:hypothetical protein
MRLVEEFQEANNFLGRNYIRVRGGIRRLELIASPAPH